MVVHQLRVLRIHRDRAGGPGREVGRNLAIRILGARTGACFDRGAVRFLPAQPAGRRWVAVHRTVSRRTRGSRGRGWVANTRTRRFVEDRWSSIAEPDGLAAGGGLLPG